MKVKILLRADYANKNGENPVCLRITQNRKVKLFSLKIYVNAKDWNEKENIVKKSDLQFYAKNLLIKKFNAKAETIISNFSIAEKYLSFSEFENLLFSEKKHSNSFYEFIENELILLSNINSFSTQKKHKSELKKLKKFRPELPFTEIDVNFLQSYKNSMVRTLHINTIDKSLVFIKTYLNKAIAKGLYNAEASPFKKFKLERIPTKRPYLTINELGTLETLYENNTLPKGLKITLKNYLFSCYTGVRFSDIQSLTFENVIDIVHESKEMKILDFQMHKTGDSVRIPLHQKAFDLLSSFEFKTQKVFRVFTNQVTNRHLKAIAKRAEISKNLTFHIARHTFATHGLYYEIPIEILSQILGHKDLRTTQIYAKVTDHLKINAINKMQKSV